MKTVNVTTVTMIMVFASLSAMSCKENKDNNSHNAMMESHTKGSMMYQMSANAVNINADAKQVIADYMTLKDALVATNKDEAAKAAKKLSQSLTSFNVSTYTAAQQKILKKIIVKANEQATQISKSDMSQQREYFKLLSKNITDMIAITGTDTQLYEQYCPMYDGGSAWLSTSKDIKNPYYGSKMLSCGKVQKQIN